VTENDKREKEGMILKNKQNECVKRRKMKNEIK
jgi:hypothetical protein